MMVIRSVCNHCALRHITHPTQYLPPSAFSPTNIFAQHSLSLSFHFHFLPSICLLVLLSPRISSPILSIKSTPISCCILLFSPENHCVSTFTFFLFNSTSLYFSLSFGHFYSFCQNIHFIFTSLCLLKPSQLRQSLPTLFKLFKSQSPSL